MGHQFKGVLNVSSEKNWCNAIGKQLEGKKKKKKTTGSLQQ